MHRSKLVAVFLLASALGLAACGQKGPLYLPADQVEQPEEATPASTEEKAKEQGKAPQ